MAESKGAESRGSGAKPLPFAIEMAGKHICMCICEKDAEIRPEEGTGMQIRRAQESDVEGINRLLFQVLAVHHEGRPDLFRENVKKYTDQELAAIIRDDSRPVFVGVDEASQQVLCYAFCVFQQYKDSNILTDIKTLYIDDLCVEKQCRGQRIGRMIYEYVLDFARREGCYNVTLNVWACNEPARRFYESCGLAPQKIGMEKIL